MPEDGEGRPFKDIRLDSVRAKYWLGVGAQPSDPAWRLLSMVRTIPAKARSVFKRDGKVRTGMMGGDDQWSL